MSKFTPCVEGLERRDLLCAIGGLKENLLKPVMDAKQIALVADFAPAPQWGDDFLAALRPSAETIANIAAESRGHAAPAGMMPGGPTIVSRTVWEPPPFARRTIEELPGGGALTTVERSRLRMEFVLYTDGTVRTDVDGGNYLATETEYRTVMDTPKSHSLISDIEVQVTDCTFRTSSSVTPGGDSSYSSSTGCLYGLKDRHTETYSRSDGTGHGLTDEFQYVTKVASGSDNFRNRHGTFVYSADSVLVASRDLDVADNWSRRHYERTGTDLQSQSGIDRSSFADRIFGGASVTGEFTRNWAANSTLTHFLQDRDGIAINMDDLRHTYESVEQRTEVDVLRDGSTSTRSLRDVVTASGSFVDDGVRSERGTVTTSTDRWGVLVRHEGTQLDRYPTGESALQTLVGAQTEGSWTDERVFTYPLGGEPTETITSSEVHRSAGSVTVTGRPIFPLRRPSGPAYYPLSAGLTLWQRDALDVVFYI